MPAKRLNSDPVVDGVQFLIRYLLHYRTTKGWTPHRSKVDERGISLYQYTLLFVLLHEMYDEDLSESMMFMFFKLFDKLPPTKGIVRLTDNEFLDLLADTYTKVFL